MAAGKATIHETEHTLRNLTARLPNPTKYVREPLNKSEPFAFPMDL